MYINSIYVDQVALAWSLADSARQPREVPRSMFRKRMRQLWPTLVEICYFQRGRKGLPQTRVNNRHK